MPPVPSRPTSWSAKYLARAARRARACARESDRRRHSSAGGAVRRREPTTHLGQFSRCHVAITLPSVVVVLTVQTPLSPGFAPGGTDTQMLPSV